MNFSLQFHLCNVVLCVLSRLFKTTLNYQFSVLLFNSPCMSKNRTQGLPLLSWSYHLATGTTDAKASHATMVETLKFMFSFCVQNCCLILSNSFRPPTTLVPTFRYIIKQTNPHIVVVVVVDTRSVTQVVTLCAKSKQDQSVLFRAIVWSNSSTY